MSVQIEGSIDLDLSKASLEELDEKILWKRLEFFNQVVREGEGQRFTGHTSSVRETADLGGDSRPVLLLTGLQPVHQAFQGAATFLEQPWSSPAFEDTGLRA